MLITWKALKIFDNKPYWLHTPTSDGKRSENYHSDRSGPLWGPVKVWLLKMRIVQYHLWIITKVWDFVAPFVCQCNILVINRLWFLWGNSTLYHSVGPCTSSSSSVKTSQTAGVSAGPNGLTTAVVWVDGQVEAVCLFLPPFFTSSTDTQVKWKPTARLYSVAHLWLCTILQFFDNIEGG